MDFISKETSTALDELVGAFFDLNRTLDRCVSIMTNEWSMPQASDIVHHNLAHLMPLMADKITEIKDRYNLASVYPETHKDNREYTDLKQMYETVLVEFGEVYDMIKMVKRIIMAHDDYNVLVDLDRVMCQYNIVMGQILTLRDKATQMPTDFDRFDQHIKSWGIVGVNLNLLQSSYNEGDDD